MLSRKRLGVLVLALMLAVQGAYAEAPDPNDPNVVAPRPLGDALRSIADDLVADQIVNTNLPGTGWPGMENYNGAITLGMVSAYNIFGDGSYEHSAERGGGWLYHDSIFQTPLGDSVLAWAALGERTDGQPWSDTSASFFDNVQAYTPGGAMAYAASFGGDASSTVYYLANLTVAAYKVNAEEKAIWREGLVLAIEEVTDESAYFPVQSIGIAAWALAITGPGPLDDSMVALLTSHQVPLSRFDPGSFYWRFNHSIDDPNTVAEGYTADAIAGVIGLFAAADANPEIVPALQAPIVAGVKAILGSLGDDGLVYEHLSLGGQSSYVYAAQMLVLADVLDLDLDIDLNALAEASTYEDLGIVLDGPIVWNPSFELPGTTKQTSFENVVGWTSADGDVSGSGVEQAGGATDGTWTAFLMGSDPGFYQVTHLEVEADDIIQLSVDAQDNGAATTLLMQLFYLDDDGAMVPVVASDVALTGEMVNSSVAFAAADDPNVVGQTLGILFDNVTEDGASWLGLDNVSIDFLAELPVVDPNAGL